MKRNNWTLSWVKRDWKDWTPEERTEYEAFSKAFSSWMKKAGYGHKVCTPDRCVNVKKKEGGNN